MTVADQRARFRAWARRRAGNVPISFVETHVSFVALTVDRVWKLKKAVRFAFVDLSTPELRQRNAEREVALNRRFAPDVYLGVVTLDDDGGPAEAVVEMRRMPESRRLSALVAAGGAGAASCIDAVAAALARVHDAAPATTEIAQVATPEGLGGIWARNLDELRPFAPAILDPDMLTRVDADATRYLAGRAPLLDARIAAGRVRDGHGDLLADDVYCLDDGPRLLDCLEFDDRLRYGDVVGDVAFLAMDLERLGHAELAARLLDAYRVASGDAWPASLADLYVAYRALVRAKVACLSVGADGARGDAAAKDAARALLALAAGHLARGRVRLVLVGGAPATGKSTLAAALGERTGWRVLRSDEVRKQLAGLDPSSDAGAPLDAGRYSPAWNARTYGALLAEAARLLELGESVVLDASWGDPARREEARRVADATASDLSCFALDVPVGVATARARARRARGGDASDATEEIAAALHERFTPWPEAVALDGSRPAAELAERILDGLGLTS